MVVAVIPRVFLCFRVQVSEIEGHSEREREREREREDSGSFIICNLSFLCLSSGPVRLLLLHAIFVGFPA